LTGLELAGVVGIASPPVTVDGSEVSLGVLWDSSMKGIDVNEKGIDGAVDGVTRGNGSPKVNAEDSIAGGSALRAKSKSPALAIGARPRVEKLKAARTADEMLNEWFTLPRTSKHH
jgi:hypothetical protein